jgi:hypothetical protein
MDIATVSKIRPVSWRISVQGKEEAEYIRRRLRETQIETTTPQEEPGLMEPTLFSFVATLQAETPITTEEIIAVLEKDERIRLAFES